MTEKKKPHPRKLQPPRLVKVDGVIHRTLTKAALNEIARKLTQEIMTGRNFEDRTEWRATWDELFHKKRGF
jgi:hypothetical protein